MASGDLIFEGTPSNGVILASNSATPDLITDASTPAILIPVLDFDGATDEHFHWFFEIPTQYAGTTGWRFKYRYAMDGADVNIVEMEWRVLIISDLDILTGDLGIDTQTAVAIQDTPAGTADKFNVTATGDLAKADFGSPSAGDWALVRGTRDESVAENTDDLQLANFVITET